MQHDSCEQSAPWWKFGYVWFVFAGPAIVVLASFVTFYLAATRPNEIVSEDHERQPIELNSAASGNSASLAPALQARNHAQTGVVVKLPSGNKP